MSSLQAIDTTPTTPHVPAYQYLLADLLTDRPLAYLPLSGVKFGRRIAATGSLSATLHAPNARQAQLARMLRDHVGRAALWVLRDGQPWWGGIPWQARAKQGTGGAVALEVQAATFDSYADHRTLRDTLTFTQVDQGVILPALWRHLQADPRGDIGVVAEDQPTGVLRDRTYLGTDLAKYGKRITELANVAGGPEYVVNLWTDGEGQRVKELRVASRLGTTTPSAVFTRARRGGGRIVSWTDETDAVDGGTVFQTRGDSAQGNVGTDKAPLLSDVVYDDARLARGWPLLDVTQDRRGVNRKARLDDDAEALATLYGGAPRTYGYEVEVGATGWSPNRLGDLVRLKLADLWHSPSADRVVRPVGCEVVAADRTTAERVTLLLGEDDD